jgi:hypothetical protein
MTDENDAILISNRFLSFVVLSISFILSSPMPAFRIGACP